MVVDATGINVYGQGEWKVRCHDGSKRRTWRKLHVGVDEANGEIVAAAVTTNNCSDGQLLPELLDQIDADIVQVSGDRAYDTGACYAAISARKAQAAIPPRRGARIWRHGNSNDPPLTRDESLRSIRRAGRVASGEERSAITAATKPRQLYFVLRPSLVIGCTRAALRHKPQRCLSAAAP